MQKSREKVREKVNDKSNDFPLTKICFFLTVNLAKKSEKSQGKPT